MLSRFLKPVNRDLTTSFTQRKTPDALVTISSTNSVHWPGSFWGSLSNMEFSSNSARTYARISGKVRSCNRSPGRCLKISSKTIHGRLDTQTLTWGEEEISLNSSAIPSWYPSYSSSPSIKKQSFNDEVAKSVSFLKPFCNFSSDQCQLGYCPLVEAAEFADQSSGNM